MIFIWNKILSVGYFAHYQAPAAHSITPDVTHNLASDKDTLVHFWSILPVKYNCQRQEQLKQGFRYKWQYQLFYFLYHLVYDEDDIKFIKLDGYNNKRSYKRSNG